MRVYHERLRVPVSWWVLGMISVFMLGAGFLAGFDWEPALAVYGILTVGLAAILLGWGWLRTEVADGELRVGRDRLPLAQAGEVTALDEEQTRALRGPAAPPWDDQLAVKPARRPQQGRPAPWAGIREDACQTSAGTAPAGR